jgi:hypothetical protein
VGPELIVTEFLKDITTVSNTLIEDCETLEDLEKLRIVLVGKNGILSTMQKEMNRLFKDEHIRTNTKV